MATKYKYDKDTDYAALMEQAARRGDNAAAAVYEQQRNAKIRGEVIPATGAHTWDNGTVTTEPTETTPGVRTFTCAVCSQTKTEVIPATGAHTFVFTKNVAPSCTEAGYDLYTCRDCGATEKRNSKPALGHKWDSGTVTPYVQ